MTFFHAAAVPVSALGPGIGTVAHRCAEINRRQLCASRSMTRCTRYTPLLVFLNRLAAFVRKPTDANGDATTLVVRRCDQ